MYVGKDNRTEHLIDNFRPTQPLFGRTIYSNFEMMINTGEEDKGMEPKGNLDSKEHDEEEFYILL